MINTVGQRSQSPILKNQIDQLLGEHPQPQSKRVYRLLNRSGEFSLLTGLFRIPCENDKPFHVGAAALAGNTNVPIFYWAEDVTHAVPFVRFMARTCIGDSVGTTPHAIDVVYPDILLYDTASEPGKTLLAGMSRLLANAVSVPQITS